MASCGRTIAANTRGLSLRSFCIRAPSTLISIPVRMVMKYFSCTSVDPIDGRGAYPAQVMKCFS